MNRQDKSLLVENLSNTLSTSQIAVCINYQGLTVAEISDLRKRLRGVNARGLVVKNTLSTIASKKALKESRGGELDRFISSLKGPTMVAYSFDDPIEPAKVIAKYVNENSKVAVKGAFFEGEFLNDKALENLSKMPGKKELLAQLLQIMNAPATQLLRVTNAPAVQLLTILDKVREMRETK